MSQTATGKLYASTRRIAPNQQRTATAAPARSRARVGLRPHNRITRARLPAGIQNGWRTCVSSCSSFERLGKAFERLLKKVGTDSGLVPVKVSSLELEQTRQWYNGRTPGEARRSVPNVLPTVIRARSAITLSEFFVTILWDTFSMAGYDWRVKRQ